MEMNGQLHAPAVLTQVPTGKEDVWIPGACLDTESKRKYTFLVPCRKSNPGHPPRSLVIILS